MRFDIGDIPPTEQRFGATDPDTRFLMNAIHQIGLDMRSLIRA
jgi:hypothetical protein